MSDFSFFCVGPDALPHLPMPPGYHFSRKNTAAADNAASLHISLLHTNKRKTSELCQNSTKTTQTYPLFSFIFPVFLSVFIHFYLFFHIFLHIPCCRYFCVSFFVFVSAAAGECGRQAGPGRGSGGVWPAGETWARQRGVWPANYMYGVCSRRAETLHPAMWLLPLACLQTTQWLCRP